MATGVVPGVVPAARYTLAIPQNSHGNPIQVRRVPVKVSVAVAVATSDASTVPLLDVTPVWLSARVDHGPTNETAVS